MPVFFAGQDSGFLNGDDADLPGTAAPKPSGELADDLDLSFLPDELSANACDAEGSGRLHYCAASVASWSLLLALLIWPINHD